MTDISSIVRNIEPIPKPEKQKKPYKITGPGKFSMHFEYAGVLKLSKSDIEEVLGISPNADCFDTSKSKYQWNFCINGKSFSIYERHGEHFVECEPNDASILQNCFLGFFSPK